AYLQFLRERNMSVGLYALDAAVQDPQQPHHQDEVYFVVSGPASITVGMETTQVARGSVVYVPAGVAHKFHHISEDLRVLVVFSPPESCAGHSGFPRGSVRGGQGIRGPRGTTWRPSIGCRTSLTRPGTLRAERQGQGRCVRFSRE